jgi:hypothetical protein
VLKYGHGQYANLKGITGKHDSVSIAKHKVPGPDLDSARFFLSLYILNDQGYSVSRIAHPLTAIPILFFVCSET